MFDKEDFRDILYKARGKRSNEQYAQDSGVSRPYISNYINAKRDEPPSPDILLKLSKSAHNGISYFDFMIAAGYITSNQSENDKLLALTRSVFKDTDINSESLMLHLLNSNIIKKEDATYKSIPLLGAIKCESDFWTNDNINSYISIPGGMDADFAITVEDDSMIDAGILEEDIAICKKMDNTIVGKVNVFRKNIRKASHIIFRYYLTRQDTPVLRAANLNYKDIKHNMEEYDCIGCVVGLLRISIPDYSEYETTLKGKDQNSWRALIEKASSYKITPQELSNTIEMMKKIRD